MYSTTFVVKFLNVTLVIYTQIIDRHTNLIITEWRLHIMNDLMYRGVEATLAL